MASIYMNIEKFEPKGVATIKGPEGVYMAVKSYSWGAARNVGMDIGNMNNRAAGVGSMEKIVITREMDGGSNALLTSAYKFENTKGKKMTFVFLKPKLDGSANDVYYKVELTDARICSYNISCDRDCIYQDRNYLQQRGYTGSTEERFSNSVRCTNRCA